MQGSLALGIAKLEKVFQYVWPLLHTSPNHRLHILFDLTTMQVLTCVLKAQLFAISYKSYSPIVPQTLNAFCQEVSFYDLRELFAIMAEVMDSPHQHLLSPWMIRRSRFGMMKRTYINQAYHISNNSRLHNHLYSTRQIRQQSAQLHRFLPRIFHCKHPLLHRAPAKRVQSPPFRPQIGGRFLQINQKSGLNTIFVNWRLLDELETI